MNTKTLLKCSLTFLICGATLVFPMSAGAAGKPDGQKEELAIVGVSAVYMRQAPDYESALETQELMGREVKILERKGYWCRIACGQPYEAWTTYMNLVLLSPERAAWWKNAEKVIAVCMTDWLKDGPDANAGAAGDLVFGDILVAGCEPECDGYVNVVKPDGKSCWVKKGSVMALEQWERRNAGLDLGSKVDMAIAFAERLKGVPYLWGGMTPKGVDCSGLVRLAYMNVGVRLPRNGSQMAKLGTPVQIPGSLGSGVKCKPDFSKLRRGDLLFFGRMREDGSWGVTHVALYIGDNHIIHSSHLVRVNSLVNGEADYYENAHKLLGACRILE